MKAIKKGIIERDNSDPRVTTEMVLAGVDEFNKYDRRFDDEKDIVIRIFRSMLAARD